MHRGRPFLAWLARATTLLVLAVFLARVAIPQGFMPEVNRVTGEITVTMCSGDGSQRTIKLSVPLEKPSTPKAGSTCDYAMAMAAVLPTPNAIRSAAIAHVYKLALVAEPPAPIRAAWVASAPPTGPPAQT